MIHLYFLIVVLLICSAFFSGMEAAIFSLNKFRVKSLLFDNIKGAKSLSRIKDRPFNTLSTLLFFNNLVNIGASSVATIIINHILLRFSLTPAIYYALEIFLMTFILLVMGEITPKTIFLNSAEYLGLRLSFFVELLTRLTFPFAKFLNNILNILIPYKRGIGTSEEDIKKMLAEAKSLNILDEVEEQLAYRLLKFSKTLVGEIMIPAERAVGVYVNQTVDEAMRLMRETGHSRICVYQKDDIQKVAGILYAKDLILKPFSSHARVYEYMRQPFWVLKTMAIDELLVDFRKKGIHFAVVSDEQGKFTGIITLNDVLKYLFGNFPGI
ncbi:MAG: hemolysin family protein [candidate division WOR-3 bacterium]|nr:hemolysin family protein [candidate division WOR-3 bacterium]